MSDTRLMNTLRLHLCQDCLASSGAGSVVDLQMALDAEIPDYVSVTLAPCLEQCDVPLVMTLQSDGGAGYVFSDINLQADTPDIIATCRAYLNSPDGWIEDARPCGRLRFCLSARLPA